MKYTEEIARTTKDPSILIDILRTGDSEYLCILAVINRNCPLEILVEILKRGTDNYSQYAARNPICPSEILVEVLERGKNDLVSYWASINPNCPIEAKINWMMKTGRILKEDPSKHIIEYEKIKEDDFQDLKDLL